MEDVEKYKALENAHLLPKNKIFIGIITYIIVGELLKDAIIFPVVEPYLLTLFSPFVTELLAECTEYLLLSAILVPITFFFIIRPVHAAGTSLTRKKREMESHNAQLESEKNLLDIMFREHASIMLIIDCANGGRILDANNSALAFYGYTYEEITNLCISEINTSGLDEVQGAMSEAYAGAQNVFVFSHKLKDGEHRHVEVHSSKMNIQGKKILFSIIHDITDKLGYQRKLQENEEKFRIIFENSGDANYLSTLDGRILDANTAFLNLFGYEPEHVSGLRTQDLYIDADDRIRFIQEVSRRGSVKDFEEKLQTRDGKPLDCLVTTTVRRCRNGSVIGYHGSIRDITEDNLRQVERDALISELQKALSKVRTLSGFLPICSHCKKIRDDTGYWTQIENYIRDHSDAEFSHSICQDCAKEHYSDLRVYTD